MNLIAPTATRVAMNTSPSVNRSIRAFAARRIADQQRHDSPAVARRLDELMSEWDVERAIETEAPLMIAGGISAAVWLDRRFIVAPLFAASMLLLHGVQGWYPMLPMFRSAGLRTTREIADEAYELKSEHGDFDDIMGASPEETASRAYSASAWTHGDGNAA